MLKINVVAMVIWRIVGGICILQVLGHIAGETGKMASLKDWIIYFINLFYKLSVITLCNGEF